MTRARARRVAVMAAVVLPIAGCGGSESALQQTSDRLADIKSGTLSLSVRLVPKASKGVSVALRGPFSVSGDRPLPVARIRYVQRAGRTVRATFTSTGTKAYVTTQGRVVRLTGNQLTGLRVGAGDTKSLDDLGLHVDRWIKGAKTTAGPSVDGADTERITGPLDASQAFGDLAQVAGQTGLSDDEVQRLARTVSGASIEILTGKDDHLLRRLRLAVALAVPPDLRAKAGGASLLTVKVALSIRDVNRPVRVDPPPGA